MEFCHFFLLVIFVVLAVDQFVERGDGPFEITCRSRIATFFEKLAHFLRFVRKIRVITAQTSESKKLRIGNGIFDMGWVG